jgi:DUF1680 family protein
MKSLKAYEVLANYEGLFELYRVTGDRRYFEGLSNFLTNLREQELMVHGSMSNNEYWFRGTKNQTAVLEQSTETCVTAQWMLLCNEMLQLTGESKWADMLETSLYNALLGAMTPDGHWWAYFAYLNGERVPCQLHHPGLGMVCCVASGPRGLLLTPQWAVMKSRDGIAVNLYAEGAAKLKLDNGVEVELLQQTSYPETGNVHISITPKTDSQFTLSLRIPSWSKSTQLLVNGQSHACEPGTYATINRVWTKGNRVELALDLRGRAIPAPSGAPEIALARGPVLLSLDSRLAKLDDRAVYVDRDRDGYVSLRPVTPPSGIWMAFEVPTRTLQGPGTPRRSASIVLCDYASAGNLFLDTNTFRTWLPQPMQLSSALPKDIWKLAYGRYRPRMPALPPEGAK